MITLNVGMERADAPDLTPRVVRREATRVFRRIAALHGSLLVTAEAQELPGAEDTLVCRLWVPDRVPLAALQERVALLAATLDRDCIAADIRGVRSLEGPEAARWSPFDPSRFITWRRALALATELHV